MVGRPRSRLGSEHTTSLSLGQGFQEGLLQLQLLRLRANGKKPTQRDLLEEGINALLKQEGLEPVRPAAIESREGSVVSITKKLS